MDSYNQGIKVDRYATDWGLASFLIGGLLVGMAPAQLIFNLLYWKSGIHLIPKAEMEFHRLATFIYAGCICIVLIISLFAGFRGLNAARQRDAAAALPLAGILASFLALVMWIGLSLNMIAIQNVL